MVTTAQARVAPPQIKLTKLFINNEWVESSSKKSFETYNPATGEVIASVSEGSADDVDRALDENHVRDVAVGVLVAVEARVLVDLDAPAADEMALEAARRHAQELQGRPRGHAVGVDRLVVHLDAHGRSRLRTDTARR